MKRKKFQILPKNDIIPVMDILGEITSKISDDLESIKSSARLKDLKNISSEKKNDRRGFYQSLINSDLTPALIAEVKYESPSAGEMSAPEDISKRVKIYCDAGAAAISVLTEKHFFHGSIDNLLKIRGNVDVPVLRKDFIIDEYQIWETASLPADAVLLIARCLSKNQLEDYIGLCNELELDVLLEVFSPDEIEWVLETPARIIGVNNRDLETFDTDINKSLEIKKMIPDNYLSVSESGIHNRKDMCEINKAGFQAVLIGETLMKTPLDNLPEKISSLY